MITSYPLIFLNDREVHEQLKDPKLKASSKDSCFLCGYDSLDNSRKLLLISVAKLICVKCLIEEF